MAHPSKDQSVLIFTSPSLAALYTCALIALPTGPKGQGGFGGGMRSLLFSPRHLGYWTPGDKSEQGEQRPSLLSATPHPQLPSSVDQELRFPEGEVAGTWGRYSSKPFGKIWRVGRNH